MLLSDLLQLEYELGFEVVLPDNISVDARISGISSDSRECKEGYIFAAIKGVNIDGIEYVGKAIGNGARYIIVDIEFKGEILAEYSGKRVALLFTKNPAYLMGMIAAHYYSHIPFNGQPANIAAVTGTNGKTTIVHFCRKIWHLMGKKTASIGTLGLIEEGGDLESHFNGMTTPDSVALHKMLSEISCHGGDYVAIEASSHGLKQDRLVGVRVDVAAITNISRDHLDYHGDFEDYFKSKMLLFSDILKKKSGIAVINADIDRYDEIYSLCKRAGHKIISYGRNSNDIRIIEIKSLPSGQEVRLEINNLEYKLSLDLIGDFQVENLACAIAISVAFGFDIDDIMAACTKIIAVSGRMEKVAEIYGASIIVDYAHTPDALEKVLKAVRPHCVGKVLVLFGCGGDRDIGKRPLMGKIADKYANFIVVTDDNPRDENASIIRQDILKKCPNAHEIADREKAIEFAIDHLNKGDILVVAGKGHENVQLIQGESIPFDDSKIVRKVVGRLV